MPTLLPPILIVGGYPIYLFFHDLGYDQHAFQRWMDPCRFAGGIVGAIFSFKTRWRGFIGGIIILGYIGAIYLYGWLVLITLCLPR